MQMSEADTFFGLIPMSISLSWSFLFFSFLFLAKGSFLKRENPPSCNFFNFFFSFFGGLKQKGWVPGMVSAN